MQANEPTFQNKKFPDTLVIILAIMALFIVLTWILPAGEFERTILNGRQVIVPGSYAAVDAAPQGIGAFFQAPIKGFISAAQIIAFVFLVGGSFAIITQTGAIDAGLQSIIQLSKKNPRYRKWIIPLIITLFSLAGATFGMSEEVLVFILITIPLALALGYDSITGVAISFVGAGLGFAGAFINPFTVGVAQGIAELTPGSGIGFRLIAWLVTTVLGILYIMRYTHKIEKDLSLSPVYELDKQRMLTNTSITNTTFTTAHKAIIFALFIALAILVVGVSKWGWYINEIAALFIAVGFCSSNHRSTFFKFKY